MLLVFEDRAEMQRSMKKASIRDVFVRRRDGIVRVTALIDNRSMACYEYEGGPTAVQDEVEQWKGEHFEVARGEVMMHPEN